MHQLFGVLAQISARSRQVADEGQRRPGVARDHVVGQACQRIAPRQPQCLLHLRHTDRRPLIGTHLVQQAQRITQRARRLLRNQLQRGHVGCHALLLTDVRQPCRNVAR